MPEVALTQDAV